MNIETDVEAFYSTSISLLKILHTNNTVWVKTISNFLINKMFQYSILLRLNIYAYFFSKIKCFNLLDMEYILKVNWVNSMSFLFWLFSQENFEDTKRIIISQKSKDRQYNGQKKKDKQCLTFRK
jgi:hypothetical protein